MKPIGLSSPDLIVRSTSTRSEAGRLEGRRLARPSPCGHPSRRIACAMLPGDEVRNDADMIRIRGTLTQWCEIAQRAATWIGSNHISNSRNEIALATHRAPGFVKFIRPEIERARGMPGDQCTRSLVYALVS